MASSSSDSLPQPNEAERLEIEPMMLPTVEEIGGQDIQNNCLFRGAFNGVIGGGFGLVVGLFLGALTSNPSMQEKMTTKQEFIFVANMMGRRGYHHAKSFAVMGLVFSATECAVEKARGKHDITSTIVAGCVTGGTLSAKGGPKAACVGCVGFGTFSVVFEKFFERHLPEKTSTPVFPN